MTVGERIAQQRKLQQMSQEALGEALGVSRQAISKWEADTTLPEVEKLVSMSRLFHVPVGVLLGVEEEPEAATELDEWQLTMVEEIVSRYLSARNGDQEGQTGQRIRKPKVAAVLALVLACAVLLGAYRNLNQKIDDVGDEFRENIEYVKSSMEVQMDSLTGRVEEILKAQNQLTAVYAVERGEVDVAENTITFRLSATPKTYEPGMKAMFVAESGGAAEQQAAEGQGPDFAAELTCPLTDSIALSVCFQRGEVLETQLLEVVTGAERGTKYDFRSGGGSYDQEITVKDDGTVWFGGSYISANFTIGDISCAEQVWIDTVEVGYYVNFEPASVVQAGVPTARDPVAAEKEPGTERRFAYLPQTTVAAEPGDVIVIGAVATDNFGRQTRWAAWSGQVEERGILENVALPEEWT